MGIFKNLFGSLGAGHHGNKDSYRRNKHGSKHGYPEKEAPYQDAYNNQGISCPKCRASNIANARFCQQCGSSMVPPSCTQCGMAIAADAKFCGQCGKQRG